MNQIEKISCPKFKNLKILSVGRNNIKRITLENVEHTLEQLWISYNGIDKLDGLDKCVNLHTLYISNNKIKSWDEVAKLALLPKLKSLLLHGNPIC